jgi:hypothetical protein
VPTKVPRKIRPSVTVIRKVSRKRALRRDIDGVFRWTEGEETVEDGGDEDVGDDMVICTISARHSPISNLAFAFDEPFRPRHIPHHARPLRHTEYT